MGLGIESIWEELCEGKKIIKIYPMEIKSNHNKGNMGVIKTEGSRESKPSSSFIAFYPSKA